MKSIKALRKGVSQQIRSWKQGLLEGYDYIPYSNSYTFTTVYNCVVLLLRCRYLYIIINAVYEIYTKAFSLGYVDAESFDNVYEFDTCVCVCDFCWCRHANPELCYSPGIFSTYRLLWINTTELCIKNIESSHLWVVFICLFIYLYSYCS